MPRVPVLGVPQLASILDDRYRLVRELGRGGMGVVYAAEATRLGDRPCAVKVLRPEFTHDAVAVARFRREAAVAARIKHPHVVEIFDTGTTASGLGYIAMELLTGETLAHTLRRAGRLPWTRVRRLLLQICGALAAAHAQQVVHRDMKPDNCLLLEPDDPAEIIKILDFGIAKRTFDGDPRLTATDALVGTHAYMSCEQVRGEDIDPRTDVWSVGVILYELLTGLLPFRGRNAGQIWTAITHYDPEPLDSVAPDADIPPDVDAIVRRALARALPDRFPTIDALAQALAAVPDDPAAAATSRPQRPAPVAVVDALATTHSHAAGPVPADSRRERLVRVRDLVIAGALFIALQVVVAAVAVFIGLRLLAP